MNYSFEALVHATHNDSRTVRLWAIHRLTHTYGERAIEILIRALGDEDYGVAYTAADLLIALGTPSVPPLLHLLANRTPILGTQLAIRALGNLGDPQALEPLLVLLDEAQADLELRRSAAFYLGRLKDQRAREPLLLLLQRKSEDITLRCHAAHGLGELGSAHAVPSLLSIVKEREEHPGVRHATLSTLMALGGTDVLGSLIDELEEDDPLRAPIGSHLRPASNVLRTKNITFEIGEVVKQYGRFSLREIVLHREGFPVPTNHYQISFQRANASGRSHQSSDELRVGSVDARKSDLQGTLQCIRDSLRLSVITIHRAFLSLDDPEDPELIVSDLATLQQVEPRLLEMESALFAFEHEEGIPSENFIHFAAEERRRAPLRGRLLWNAPSGLVLDQKGQFVVCETTSPVVNTPTLRATHHDLYLAVGEDKQARIGTFHTTEKDSLDFLSYLESWLKLQRASIIIANKRREELGNEQAKQDYQQVADELTEALHLVEKARQKLEC